jgi:hypothetical protein
MAGHEPAPADIDELLEPGERRHGNGGVESVLVFLIGVDGGEIAAIGDRPLDPAPQRGLGRARIVEAHTRRGEIASGPGVGLARGLVDGRLEVFEPVIRHISTVIQFGVGVGVNRRIARRGSATFGKSADDRAPLHARTLRSPER